MSVVLVISVMVSMLVSVLYEKDAIFIFYFLYCHDSLPGLTCYPELSSTNAPTLTVQELCESRGGRAGLSVLTNLLVSVDVKLY